MSRLVEHARRLWRRRRAHRLFQASGLFDSDWYARTYGDLGGLSPMDHYLETGAEAGCRPHPLFDSAWYAERYDDVGQSPQNPLIHFLMSGDAEGRDPNPYFATRWYKTANRDWTSATTALGHYASVGARALKDPSPLFDTRWYAETNPDAAGWNPLSHFLVHGRAEGRKPTPLGDDSFRGEPVNAARLTAFKALEPIAGQTVALFVAHTPEGALKPHVAAYVRALSQAGVKVVLIAATDRPFSPDESLTPLLAGGFVRENKGFDFAAWAHLLRAEPSLFTAETLLLVNDSVIGPMNAASLDELLRRIRNSRADVVGSTESREYTWHLQSFFLALKRPVLASFALHDFIGSVRSLDDKDHVIKAYELRFTARMQAAGFVCEAAFPSRDEVNQTVFHWKALLEAGYPFAKTLTLRGVFEGVDVTGWEQALADHGFDPTIARAAVDATASAEKLRGAWPLLKAPALPAAPVRPWKVAFIGPWNYASGLGSASRGYVSALWRAGLRLNLHPIERPFHIHARVAPTVNVREFDGPADLVIVHLNPDGWHLLTEAQHAMIAQARTRAGIFVWEMAHVPQDWKKRMATLDAVWAPSRYCADIFAQETGAAVDVVPHVVPVGPPADVTGRGLMLRNIGLPDDARIILYAFDGASYLVRKNPHALVRAFAASGLAKSGWKLVLKTKHLMDRPEEGGAFKALADATDGVVVVDRPLSREDMEALFAAADIYASPHRSEGFGLTIAEAMAAGKPVVATDYSGSRDFLDAACGYPVPGVLETLERTYGHYTKGGQWFAVDEAALQAALRQAAADLDAGKGVGEAARAQIAARLSADAVAQALRGAVDRLMSQSQGGAAA